MGNVLTGLFAQASVAGFDGVTDIPGGWLDHHYIQLGYQLADSVSGMSYSFVMTVRLPPFPPFSPTPIVLQFVPAPSCVFPLFPHKAP